MAIDTRLSAGTELLSPIENRRSSWLRLFLYFFSLSAVTITVITAIFAYQINHYWASTLREEISRDLIQKANMFAARVNSDRSHNIDVITSQEGQGAGARATVIDSAGKLVADSEIPIVSLDKEGSRPEFVSALHGSIGIQTRSSNKVEVLFVAVPVAGGAVRLAYPLADVESAAARARNMVAIAFGAAILLAVCASAGVASSVSHG
jgi:hypothetical protein